MNLLTQGNLLPVTSNQDFFGISVIEAVACGVTPILPNRLAFPEHFPGSDCYYENEEELYQQVVQGLSGSKDMSAEVDKYDWRLLVKQYDAGFEEVLLRLKDHV